MLCINCGLFDVISGIHDFNNSSEYIETCQGIIFVYLKKSYKFLESNVSNGINEFDGIREIENKGKRFFNYSIY